MSFWVRYKSICFSRCVLNLFNERDPHLLITPLLSQIASRVAFDEWKLRKSRVIIEREVIPVSSPLLEDMSSACPSTGLWPCMHRSSSHMSSILPVEIIHAWDAVLSRKEASLAPNSLLLLADSRFISSCPLSHEK